MHRIFFLAEIHPNKLGSMEEMMLFLGRALAKRGDELHLGVIAEPDPVVGRMLSNAGIKVINVASLAGVNGQPTSLQQVLFMRRFIRDNSFDLVHVNFFGLTDAMVIGAYFSGTTVVYTEHTSGAVPCRPFLKNALSRFKHFFIVRRVSKYVAVSDFVRNRLLVSHHVPLHKTVTIYNGVNVERFSPRDRDEARRLTALPASCRIVLAVAMLIPEKGIQHLLHAAALLVKDEGLGDLCVAIAGEGHYQRELEKMATDLGISGHVLFLGRRSDVDLLIAAADVVAVPAVWEESFGLIIAEAMASGRPVVASRVGGIPEVVTDGETGYLVAPGDSRALAEGIGKAFAEEGKGHLSHAARAKVCEQFNLSRQVEKFVELYGEVLRG